MARARSAPAARALAAIGLAAAVVVAYVALKADGGRGAAGSALVAATPVHLSTDFPTPERLRARVLASFPHDPTAYTQGLEWEGGAFLESGGGYGRSFVRRWRPGEAHPLAERRLPDQLFAEGLAVVGERVIQITWREGVALYRDRATLEELERRSYEGEGWGLCWDGRRLIMSDGTDTLTLRDPETFALVGSVVVRTGTVPVLDLNELECAHGSVYANLYGSDLIARIDPASGQVSAMIDASGLLSARERAGGADVLNGIAYNADTETFYLTGKLWPRLFEVVFEPAADPVRP